MLSYSLKLTGDAREIPIPGSFVKDSHGKGGNYLNFRMFQIVQRKDKAFYKSNVTHSD